MVCKTCGAKGILNLAGGVEFWFCRDCRIEITSDPFLCPKASSEYEDFLDSIKVLDEEPFTFTFETYPPQTK